MSEEFQEIIRAMQEAVDEELIRKAKLGYNAVVADEHGNSKVIPAIELIKNNQPKIQI